MSVDEVRKLVQEQSKEHMPIASHSIHQTETDGHLARLQWAVSPIYCHATK